MIDGQNTLICSLTTGLTVSTIAGSLTINSVTASLSKINSQTDMTISFQPNHESLADSKIDILLPAG